MAKQKIITKDDILRAMKFTKSNMQAARYLGVYYTTYKRVAQLYIDEKTGKSLFDLHKRMGRGKSEDRISKDDIPLNRLIGGVCEFPKYPLKKLKSRLINEYVLAEECGRCGFNEARIKDYKVPLLLSFKDKNRFNWEIKNLQFLCYNCYFLTGGDIFDEELIKNNDDFSEDKKIESDVWEVDDYMKQHLINLGILDEDNELDFTDYSK